MRGKFLPSNSWKGKTARIAVHRWRRHKSEECPLTVSRPTARMKRGV
jgi:hypothetical protein